MAKITEKLLLDNYVGIAGGLDIISDIGDKRYFWSYRKCAGDGYHPMVQSRDEAVDIYAGEYAPSIIELDPECADHPTIAKIENDYMDIINGI